MFSDDGKIGKICVKLVHREKLVFVGVLVALRMASRCFHTSRKRWVAQSNRGTPSTFQNRKAMVACP